jgi:hypothetical protein
MVLSSFNEFQSSKVGIFLKTRKLSVFFLCRRILLAFFALNKPLNILKTKFFLPFYGN